MHTIRLSSRPERSDILVPRRFLEQYMPSANGEFVKVYLWLLKSSQEGASSVDPEQIADRLFLTGKDVVRALKYWQGEGLIEASFTEDGEISELILSDPPFRETVAPEISLPDPSPKEHASMGRLPAERVKALKQDPVMMQLLFLAEKYLGKTLSSTEINRIFYFYDELHMSPDLIEYLIEYCVTHNHRSMRYMETVAVSWTEQGIRTVQEAQESNRLHTKEYYQVLKALGITNRSPVEEEVSYIDTWTGKYGFDFSIIFEACTRTVMKTGQGSFPYTDRILSDWKAQNVRTLDDIRTIDRLYQAEREKKENRDEKQSGSGKKPNRFNNFHQRDYDFDEVEKQLLNTRPDN